VSIYGQVSDMAQILYEFLYVFRCQGWDQVQMIKYQVHQVLEHQVQVQVLIYLENQVSIAFPKAKCTIYHTHIKIIIRKILL